MSKRNDPETQPGMNNVAEQEPMQEVQITRIFNAPRKLVFDAWTTPARLQHWYAPNGCTIEIRDFDFREGGSFLHCIHNPDFHDCWCKGVFQEIIVPERIVYSLVVADEKGNAISSTAAGKDAGWPAKTVVTVTFTEENGRTRLSLHQTVSEALAKQTGAYPSWLQMLNRLEIELITI